VTDLDELIELYSHLHNIDDPLPERNKVEEVYRFYESVGFDRYTKQAFLAKRPQAFSAAGIRKRLL